MALANGVRHGNPMEFSGFATDILNNKHYLHLKPSGHRESWPEAVDRVVGNVVGPYLPELVPALTQLMLQRKFLPGGRYLYAAGRRFPAINNCYLLSVEDSRESWGSLMNRSTNCLMTGGGIGVVYSKLRPEDAPIAGLGGKSTGPCALMKMVNEAARYIVQGGSRRSAVWAGLRWNHPDIFKFIHIKDWDELTREGKRRDFNFPAPMDGTNISVILDDAFFAAFHSPLNPDHKLAQSVYYAVVASMLRTGEPGFSIDTGDNEGENLRNACLTGDTLVATADGRGAVPIKDLVGTSTPVYAADAGGRVKVGTLKNVRVTRRRAAIVKVTLDDGSSVRLTPDHEIMLADGSFREAGTLQPGAQLMPFWSEVRQDYRRVRCRRKWHKQCLMILGRSDCARDGYDVHHMDGDHLNDSPANLGLLTHSEHAALKMRGDNNPTRRLGYDKAWRIRQSIASTGRRNGRFLDGRRTEPRAMARLHGTTLAERGVAATCAVCEREFVGGRGARTCSKHCGATLGIRERARYDHRTVVSVEPDGFEDVYDGSVAGLACFAIVTGGEPTRTGSLSGIVVHNCTEVTSADDGDVCNLSSLNMARFNGLNALEEFTEAVNLVTAFLLCGTLYAKLPLAEMHRTREKNRRLGLGLMGVHEWMLRRGLPYGPSDELAGWMKSYRLSGPYANRWADRLGVSRPVATRAVAPTGTIAIVAETTTSAEPLYAAAYYRRYLEGTTWRAQYVVDAIAHRLVNEGVDPDDIEDSYTLAEDPARRIGFQAWMQTHVDHGISSTLNLPKWGSSVNNEDTESKFAATLMKHLPAVRGITAYPDGARDGQPLNRCPYTEAIKYLGQVFTDGSATGSPVVEMSADGAERSCKSGVCGS